MKKLALLLLIVSQLCALGQMLINPYRFVLAPSGPTFVDDLVWFALDDTNTSVTNSFTVSAGSNRLLLVGTVTRTVSVTGVTWNGSALTIVTNRTYEGNALVVYRLIAPDSGNYDLIVTYSASTAADKRISLFEYTGVNQTTPLGTPATASGIPSPITVNVSSASGEAVVDFAVSGSAPTVGAGQIERSLNQGSQATFASLNVSEESGAATVTMSWTTASDPYWVTAGVSIKPQ